MSKIIFNTSAVNFICIIIAGLFLTSCASPQGSARLYKADKDKGMISPFTKIDENTIKKKKANAIANGEDVFAVYFTDAFFRYLPDWGGVNEVIIVAEVTEVVTGKKENDVVTRILGPYTGVADKSKASFINKLLYGPKKLESDHISIKLSILEYDQGENADNAAFLDFIGSVSENVALSDPVTKTEITFAKEIAKSLLASNKDDLVMQIDFDMVANSANLINFNKQSGRVIPLNPGNYVIVNQENCSVFTCFAQLSDEANSNNPVAWIGDALLALPIAINRGFTDTPDNSSLRDISDDDLAALMNDIYGNSVVLNEVVNEIINEIESSKNILKETVNEVKMNLDKLKNNATDRILINEIAIAEEKSKEARITIKTISDEIERYLSKSGKETKVDSDTDKDEKKRAQLKVVVKIADKLVSAAAQLEKSNKKILEMKNNLNTNEGIKTSIKNTKNKIKIALDELKIVAQKLSKSEKIKPYTDKTWLAFSIVKGGDPSLWEKRRALTKANDLINQMTKSANLSSTLLNSNYKAAHQALDEANKIEQQNLHLMQMFTPILSKDFKINTSAQAITQYCFSHQMNMNPDNFKLTVYSKADKTTLKELWSGDRTPELSNAVSSCFILTEDEISTVGNQLGHIQLDLFYTIGESSYHDSIAYEIVKE